MTKAAAAWMLPILAAWSFVSVEVGFHLNLLIHWDAIGWRDVYVLNNRPAFAVALLAGLAFCRAEGSDWANRAFLAIPATGTLSLIAIPSEQLWYLIFRDSAYPDRVSYGIGQWLWTSLIFYVATIPIDFYMERKKCGD